MGDLIRHHRKQAEMTLVQLEELSKVDKASISRIESGQTKRPNLPTIRKISSRLKIPYVEMMERYIEIEERSEVLFTILDDFQGKDISLVIKLAKKILQSPTMESVDLVEMLFDFVARFEEPSIKLSLYKLIVSHSRAHGIRFWKSYYRF
nr:helix-turn-helix transcriptional regulator [Chengkuizengella sediminis]